MFAGLEALHADIYANPYRLINEAAHETALTPSLRELTEQLRSNAFSRFKCLTGSYDESAQPQTYLDDAKTQPIALRRLATAGD